MVIIFLSTGASFSIMQIAILILKALLIHNKVTFDTWQILIAILLFPIGLLALLVKKPDNTVRNTAQEFPQTTSENKITMLKKLKEAGDISEEEFKKLLMKELEK